MIRLVVLGVNSGGAKATLPWIYSSLRYCLLCRKSFSLKLFFPSCSDSSAACLEVAQSHSMMLAGVGTWQWWRDLGSVGWPSFCLLLFPWDMVQERGTEGAWCWKCAENPLCKYRNRFPEQHCICLIDFVCKSFLKRFLNHRHCGYVLIHD